MPVILSFVNSDRAQVRAAAREALAAYGQDAIWKLREAYAALTGKPANEGWTAPELANETGRYYKEDGNEKKPNTLADDLELAHQLWDRSAEWTGLPA